MFGKRSEATAVKTQTAPKSPVKEEAKSSLDAPLHSSTPAPRSRSDEPSEEYYETKATIFNALFETIDVSALAGMQSDKAREEIRTIVDEIIAIRNVRLSVAEQNQLITEICDDILGYGPLEPLLARDDIADIMVNGAKHVFIETSGKMLLRRRFPLTVQL
jgi:pilus assembly protein CpaF